MVVNDDAGHQVAPGALGFFASMLAPTGGMRMASNQAGRSAASLLIAIWLLIFLPPRGAERQGQEPLVTWGRAAFRFSK
ncbi:hypothetical protein F6476_18850 [Pseudomonas umsongensis]|nr:hypothetical protein F6476_18850 [Pseudomonas umsongensis]